MCNPEKGMLTNAVQTKMYALEKTKDRTQFSIDPGACQKWRATHEAKQAGEGLQGVDQPPAKKSRKAPMPDATRS